MVVFVVRGNTFSALIRHRLYIVAMDELAGGEEMLEALKRVVQASYLLLFAVLQLSLLLLLLLLTLLLLLPLVREGVCGGSR